MPQIILCHVMVDSIEILCECLCSLYGNCYKSRFFFVILYVVVVAVVVFNSDIIGISSAADLCCRGIWYLLF